MTSPNINTSPAIIARADRSIQDCVRLMNEHGVGSLLLVSEDAAETLVGIFTERDLLRKFDLIQGGGFWRDPVRTVMTHPVQVLEARELAKAADIMVRHRFRHLPIIVSDEKKNYRLVGVISMRDLFRTMLDAQKREVEETRAVELAEAAKGRLAVVTLDPYLVQFIESGVGKEKVRIKHCSIDDLRKASFQPQAAVVDLDNVRAEDWVSLLKELNRKPIAPLTVILFNPTLFDAKTVAILNRLKDAQSFTVFAKPVPAVSFFHLLSRFLHVR